MIYNEAGQLIVTQALTPANFMGLPLVLVADGLTDSSDPRWIAIQALCTEFVPILGKGAGFGLTAAPAVGIDPSGPDGLNDVQTLVTTLRIASKFLTPGGIRPIQLVENRMPVPYVSMRPPCGPIVAINSTSTGSASGLAAAAYSAYFTRFTRNQVFGCAMDAVGPGAGTPEEDPSPPVYNVTLSTLKELQRIWLTGGSSTADGVGSLVQAEGLLPGISLRCNPALIPYLVI